MKKIVIKSMVVLSLMIAGTMNTTTVLAQTQNTEQREETPAERKKREKAEKKAKKQREKEIRDSIKQAEKLAKIVANQKKDGSLVEQQQTSSTNNFGEEWGAPEVREQNVATYTFFENAFKNREYDKALEYMYKLIEVCPAARVGIYANGAEIYRHRIIFSKTMDEKSGYVNKLMELYDYRLAAFADHKEYGEVYILKQKAKDYFQYRSDDKQGMLSLFRTAIEKDPEIDATFINQYFSVLVEEYLELNVETDHFMGEYEFLAAKMDQVTDEQAKRTFDEQLIQSGAADCNNLELIYRGRVAKNPNDAVLLAKVFNLMSRNQCQSEFYQEVGEKYYAVAPSTEVARRVAAAYDKAGNSAKALEYLRAAMSSEADPALKAGLCVQIAGIELSSGSAREAANFARQAIELDANSAMAYFILSQSYAQAGCSDTFAKQSVYWLAFDLAAKAQTLAQDNEELQQMCSQWMGTCRAYFPKQSDCFFRGLQDGQGYNVSCGWVSGRTTVRSNK
jgi:tetratricopeptide (TPR) repeat protein